MINGYWSLISLKKKRKNKTASFLKNESGNIFFTLFGAVAIVGLLGTVVVSTMRGPLSTMVEVQSRAKAESEMSIGSRMVLLEAAEAANNGDCDGDGFVEPLEWADAGGAGPAGGGFLPATIASSRIDPWGTEYGYCAWDAGAVIDDVSCDDDTSGTYERLDGNGGSADETYTVIAVISAGPDQLFDTTCTGGASPSVSKTGDDIIVEFTYATATAATGGLWNLKSGDPDTAQISKNLEISGGATFTGGIDLTGSSAALQLGAASMLFPDETELTTCNGANDGLIRINTSTNPDSLELCDDPSGWIPIGSGSSMWTAGTGDDIYYNAGTTPQVGIGTTTPGATLDVGGTLDVSGNTDLSGTLDVAGASTLAGTSVTTLGATGAVDFDSTLNVDGSTTLAGTTVTTLGATGAVDFDSTLNVDGNTTLGGTLGVTGATTLSSTLDVTGATNLSSTLDVSGNFDVGSGDFTIDSSNGNTVVGGTLTVAGNISDSTGDVVIDDTLDVNQDANFDGDIIVQGDDSLIPSACTSDDEILHWSTTSGWSCDTLTVDGGSVGTLNLDDLSDVSANTPTTNNCLVYNGTNWVDAACSASGGIWEENASVIRISNSGYYAGTDFVFGSPQLDDDGDANHDARMFFDKSKAAFRAGSVDGTQWNDANVGNYSFATGQYNTASGSHSFSGGYNSQAAGFASFAWGNSAVATGHTNVAIGQNSRTGGGDRSFAFGQDITTTGTNSFGFGLGIASGTSPIVSASDSLGIFMGDQSGYDLSTANRMALVGGDFLIDDNGTTGSQGCVRYDGATSELQYSDDCTTFTSFSSISGTPGGSNTQVQYNDNGTFAGDSGLTFDDVNDRLTVGGSVVIGSTSGNAPTYLNLGDLGDVTISGVSDGECITYDNSNSRWVNASCTAGISLSSIQDTDGDTKIQVEEGADDDTIRFDTLGSERMTIGSTGNFALSGDGTNLNINLNDSSGYPTLSSGATHIKVDDNLIVNQRDITMTDIGNDRNTTIGHLDNSAFRITTSAGAIYLNAAANVGIGNFASDSVDSSLHVQSGDIRLDGGAANEAGCIRFDDTTDKLQFSNDCTTFSDLGSVASGSLYVDDLGDGTTDYSTNHNMYIGEDAGTAITSGQYNLALGEHALNNGATQNRNVGIGYAAIYNNTGGYNTAVGVASMYGTSTASNNSVLGYRIMFAGSGGDNSIVGYQAGYNLDGSYNVIMGSNAGYNATSMANSVLLGYQAGDSITTGQDNTVVGSQSLAAITTQSDNTVVGSEAMRYSSFGARNVAIGRQALGANNANDGVGIGFNAAGASPQNNFVIIGSEAGRYMASSNDNVVIGQAAGLGVSGSTTGVSRSVLIGKSSATGITTGDNNTFIGYQSGDSVTTGSNNILIGYDIDTPTATTSSHLNIGNLIFGDLANEDFIVGSYQLADTGTGTEDSRLFFDKSKGAFRVGLQTGTDWDDANVGNQSIAMGANPMASGAQSVAIGGWGISALADNAMAFGSDSAVTSTNSTTIGHSLGVIGGSYSTAIGNEARVTSSYSMALGLGYDADSSGGGHPTVSGTNSLGIFMGDNDGYNLSASNRMALVGGDFLIDDAGASGSQGCIRYDGANSKLQFSHDCSTYSDMGNIASGALAINDLSDGYTDYATDYNIYMGNSAGSSSSPGQYNLALGQNALTSLDGTCSNSWECNSNIAIGYDALTANTLGSSNIAIGANTLTANTDSSNSIAIGNNALSANTSGTMVAIGHNALAANTTGNSNYALGYNALSSNTTGGQNIAIGFSAAGSATTNNWMVAIGRLALSQGAEDGTAVGHNALENATGSFNTAIGRDAMRSTTTGYSNTAVGYHSLDSNVDGANNVAIGGGALGSNTSGGSNTALGTGAGGNITTGSSNIMIGRNANAPSATGSNQLNIGNLIYGDLANEDFIVGSYQLDDTGTGTEDNRMFFDSSKGAFRAGSVDGTQWDDANVGNYSAAFGAYNTAGQYSLVAGQGNSTGSRSFASGQNNNVSGATSVAIGYANTAGGNRSSVIGSNSWATGNNSIALGKDVGAEGEFSMAIGLGDAVWNGGANTRPYVTGDHSLGIFMGPQDGYTLSTNNRMALVGGDFLIDDAGATGSQGCIRYDGANSKLQFSHDCSTYSDMGGVASGAIAINDLSDAYTDYATNFNMFLGHEGSASLGADNVSNYSFGVNALNSLTNTGSAGNLGDGNIAIGTNALTAATTGWSNTAVGDGAADEITTGGANTAIGALALSDVTSNHRNTGVGYAALSGVNGTQNTALGARSATYLQSGDDNVMIGNDAGRGENTSYNYDGSDNVIIGSGAAIGLDGTNNQNTVIGSAAGATMTGGNSGNILLGYGVDVPTTTTSNHLNIGNAIYGDLTSNHIGIGISTPNDILHIEGSNTFDPIVRIRNTASNGVSGIRYYNNSGAFKGTIGHFNSAYNQTLAMVSNDNDITFVTGDTGSVAGTIRMMIDASNGNIGVGDFASDTIDSVFHLADGEIRLDGGAANEAGCIRYDDTNDKLQFSHDCSTYADMGTASLSWPLTAPDGTEAAPSYTFANSTGSGLYYTGTNMHMTTTEGSLYFDVDTDNNNGTDRWIWRTPNHTYVNKMTLSGTTLNIGEDQGGDINGLDINGWSGDQGIIITNDFSGDGDAIIKMELTEDTPLITMGLDDSDADRFKISGGALDTNDRITIETTGEIGIGDFTGDTIDSALHLASGEIRLDGGAANEAGCIRYDDTNDKLQYSHDCTTFGDFGTGAPAGNDTEIQFNNAGVMGASDRLNIRNNKLFLGGFDTDALVVSHSQGTGYSGQLNIMHTRGDQVGGIHVGVATYNDAVDKVSQFSLIGIANRDAPWDDTPIAMQQGDFLPGIGFAGTTSSSFGQTTELSAAIHGYVDGAVSSGVLPTALVFSTSETDDTGMSERLKITSSGNVGIGDFSTDTIDSVFHLADGEIRLDGGAGNEAGCIRYDDTNDKLQFSDDCTTYSDFSGGSSLWTDNTTHITRGNLHILNTGETMTTAGFDGGVGTAMIWDPDRGTLLAGSAAGTQWDQNALATNGIALGANNAISHTYNIAIGSNNSTSAYSDVAIGNANTASGGYSMVFGQDSTASGGYSTAIGFSATASGDGSVAVGETTVSGVRSLGFGLGDAAYPAPIVSGSSSLGIFMGDQSGVDLADSNTFSIMGASGGVGIGTVSPIEPLHVVGTGLFTGCTYINKKDTADLCDGTHHTFATKGSWNNEVIHSSGAVGNSVVVRLTEGNHNTNRVALGFNATTDIGYVKTYTSDLAIEPFTGSGVGIGSNFSDGTDTVESMLHIQSGDIRLDGGEGNEAGCIRFDDTSDKLQFSHDCSTYTDFSAGGGNEIFEVTGTVGTDEVVSQVDASANYATADFVFGSPQLADDGNTDHDARFFFDKSKAAFRAGKANATDWDNSNIGNYSIALGQDSRASGANSVALGFDTNATGNFSFSAGSNTTASGEVSMVIGEWSSASGYSGISFGAATAASGNYSTAIGSSTTASAEESIAFGREVTASGINSMALGLGESSGARRVVSGTNSFGIFMGDQSGYDLATTNRMALIGGDFMIDDAGATGSQGCIRYDGTNSKLQFSDDCSTYSDFSGGSSLWTDNTTHITRGNIHILNTGETTDSIAISDAGGGSGYSGIIYDTDNFALRGGTLQSGNDAWDDANIGANSFVWGQNSQANGQRSMAVGNTNTASGNNAIALGSGNNVSGLDAIGIGSQNTSSGNYSTAFGRATQSTGSASTTTGLSTIASGAASTAMGIDAQATADYSFAIGLGDPAGADPVVSATGSFGIFMGDQSGYNLATTNRMALIGGDFMIDDAGATGSQGCIRYDGTNSKLQFSDDCSTYTDLSSAGADNDWTINAASGYVYNSSDKIGVGTSVPLQDFDVSDLQLDLGTGNCPAGYTEGDWDGEADSADCRMLGAMVDISTGDFMVGTYQQDDIGSSEDNVQLYFDKSKAALRMGRTDGLGWNNSNVGSNSIGLGYNTIASSEAAVAIGSQNTASGSYSLSMGLGSTASSGVAVAIGQGVHATADNAMALGETVTASGINSLGIGLGAASGTRPAVSGASSLGIFMGDRAGYDLSDNNQMTLVGGNFATHKFGYTPTIYLDRSNGTAASPTGLSANDWVGSIVFRGARTDGTLMPAAFISAETSGGEAGQTPMNLIFGASYNHGAGISTYERMRINKDGRVGIGDFRSVTDTIDSRFHIQEGDIRLDGGVGNEAGCIRFDDTSDVLQYSHDCSTFTTMGASTSPFRVTGAAGSEVVNNNNNIAPAVTADFVFGSYQLDDTGNVAENARFFFDKSKAAFRAGSVSGTLWDSANVGNGSFAAGDQVTASGEISAALGASTASAYAAFATGESTASSDYAVAMGESSTSSGYASIAVGETATASGDSSAAFGSNTTASGTYSFTAGEGNTASGNNSVALGSNSTASAFYSFAGGVNTAAAGGSSFAFGNDVTANGEASIALGNDVTAGSGGGVGDYSLAIGLGVATGTKPSVTGDSSVGIFMGDQSGEVVSDANTFSIMGAGGGVGIGTVSPSADLHVAGSSANLIRATSGAGAQRFLVDTATGDARLTLYNGAQSSTVQLESGNAGSQGTSYLSNSLLGIGTKTPDTLLHISDSNATNSGVTAVARLTHETSGTPAAGIGASIEFEVETTDSNNEVGASISALTTDITATSENFDLAFNTMTAGAAASEKMRITSNGNVGINETTPTGGRLHVTGDTNATEDVLIYLEDDRGAHIRFKAGINSQSAGLNFQNNSSANQFYFGTLGSTATTLQLTSNQSAGRTFQFGSNIDWVDFNQDDVMVAIGEDTAEAHLEVSASGGTGGNLFLLSSDDVNDGDLLTFTETGYLGLGNTSPDVALDVTGDIEYTGTITDVSDMRLKDNIEPLNKTGSLLERINQIDTYSFTMKGDEYKRTEFGVMAQDLEKLFPELVHTAKDEIGTKSVNYIGLIAPMIEATKELQAENIALRNEISEIKTAQLQTQDSLNAISEQVALLNKMTGQNVEKASMENYLFLLLGLLGGGICVFFFGRRKA